MKHRAENPFPKLCPSGRMITNEQCTCGCLRSEHLDIAFAYGHGACTQCGGCQKFTWRRFVIVEAPVKGGVN